MTSQTSSSWLNNKPELLSQTVRQEIDDWLTRYPEDQKRSAVLAALRAVQHEQGYLSSEQMDAVAAYLGLPAIAVYEVATFYSMYVLQPVGQHTIAVCTNVSCMLCGSDEIVEYIENKLGVKTGETTADGKFSLKRDPDDPLIISCTYKSKRRLEAILPVVSQ